MLSRTTSGPVEFPELVAQQRGQPAARAFLPELFRQTQLSALQKVAGDRLLTVLGLLACANLLVSYFGDASLFKTANYVGPAVLAVFTAYAAWDLLRKVPSSIWTPYFWAIANCCFFFGIGPLVPVLGNRATRDAMASGPFGVDAVSLFRTNLLNSVGLFCLFSGLAMVSHTSWARRTIVLKSAHRLSPGALALLFVTGGAIVRFGILLPYRFGMNDFMLPGVSHLGHLIDLGFALCAYLGASGRRGWYVILALLWPLHVATIVLEFDKFPLVIAIMLPALGMFLSRRNRNTLIYAGLLAAIAFQLVQPLYIATRHRVASVQGNIHHATLDERMRIIMQTIQSPRWSPAEFGAEQHALMRLYYNGPERFVMSQYDSGRAFQSPIPLWKLFLPRFMTESEDHVSPGKELYYLVAGRRTCTVGLPIWADGYWQWGWPGTIAFSLFAGAFFGILSKRALDEIGSRQFIMLPIILVGMKIGMMGPTNFFVSTVSVVPIYVGYTLLAIVMTGMTAVRGTAHSERGATRWES